MLEYIWIKVLLLVVIHLSATIIRPMLSSKERLVNSFGAGMAIAYVFIHLLPEISKGEKHLGMYSFLVVLVGYVVYYFFNLKAQQVSDSHSHGHYGAQILGGWLYSFIIVLGMPDAFQLSHLHVVLMAVAIGSHIVHSDYHLGITFQSKFDKHGKYVLATAPIAGLVTRWLLHPQSDVLIHVIMSLLAGSLIYTVARDELPNPTRYTLMWFVIGIATYTALLMIIELN